MSRSDIAREIVILSGTGAIAGLLMWMALYLAGPLALVPGAAVLLAAIAYLTRRTTRGIVLAERVSLATLLAAQAGLLAAVIVRVIPVVFQHIL